MSDQRIRIICGVLPALLRQLVAENEVIVIDRVVRKGMPIKPFEMPSAASFERNQEAWQEKPNRRAGFASARRQAKKNRRRHG